MRSTWLLTSLLIGLLSLQLQAQQWSQPVNLDIQNQPFEEILQKLSHSHQVQFSYSGDFISVRQLITVKIINVPLREALRLLFNEANVKYTQVNDYIILHPKPKEPIKRLTKQVNPIKTKPRKERITLNVPKPEEDPKEVLVEAKPKEIEPVFPPRKPLKLPKGLSTEVREVPQGGKRSLDLTEEQYRKLLERSEPLYTEPKLDNRIAQMSVLPFIGTNLMNSKKYSNNVSLNVLWGINGGVDGLEVGTIFNSVSRHVHGIQVGGLGNVAGGEVIGTQASGLFNVAGDRMIGIQAAGLFNVAGPTDGIQVGGLFNVASRKFIGIQTAGLFNVSSGVAEGIQAAGLFNAAKGKVRFQTAGLMNVAGDVSLGQVSAFLNVADEVKGIQVGIINIADTITGPPIGLINIIRRGYNRVEFSASEILFANFALKVGATHFYNIFHVGARWDTFEQTTSSITPNPPSEEEVSMSWGLGYGFGTAIRFSPKWLVNIETVGIHINEGESWTEDLNLMGQLRLLFDVRLGHRTSVFFGPTGNAIFSRLVNPDTGEIGSRLPVYNLYENTDGNTNIKMWIGFQAGIRL